MPDQEDSAGHSTLADGDTTADTRTMANQNVPARGYSDLIQFTARREVLSSDSISEIRLIKDTVHAASALLQGTLAVNTLLYQ